MEWSSFHDALLVNAAIDNDFMFIVVKDKVPGNRTAKECKERFEYLKAKGKAIKIHTTPPKQPKSSPIIKRQRKSKEVANELKGFKESKSQSSPVRKVINKPPKKLKTAKGFIQSLQSPRKIVHNIGLPLTNIAMAINANIQPGPKPLMKFKPVKSKSPAKAIGLSNSLKRERSPNQGIRGYGYPAQNFNYANISLPPTMKRTITNSKLNPTRYKPNQSPSRTSWHTKRIQPTPKPPLINTSPYFKSFFLLILDKRPLLRRGWVHFIYPLY
jgi:hypothetical protein